LFYPIWPHVYVFPAALAARKARLKWRHGYVIRIVIRTEHGLVLAFLIEAIHGEPAHAQMTHGSQVHR
jgi:hypothetical protein